MRTQIHNSKLKASMKALVIRATDFYDKVFSDNAIPRNHERRSTVLFQVEPEVKKMPEYQTCLELVEADNKIGALLTKLVGTLSSRSNVGDADNVLRAFLAQHYLKNPEFNLKTFNENYFAFEELFYTDELRLQSVTKLYNFNMDVDEIDFGDGLKIVKTVEQKESTENLMARHRYQPYRLFSKSKFTIQRKYIKKRIVGNDSRLTDKVQDELKENPEIFDLVIKSLRLLKSSGVYRDHVITSETLTFLPISSISSRSPFKDSTIIGSKCELSDSEADEVKDIFKKLQKVENKRFMIAINRLYFSLEKDSPNDKVIDYMIGFEALYLPNENMELGTKLSLRVAFMLEEDSEKREELFNFIKKMYRLRGSIVHGEKNSIKKSDIIKLEDFFRKTIKARFKNEERFESGYLSGIYFD